MKRAQHQRMMKNQERQKHYRYYKRLENLADHENSMGKFKKAEGLYLKAADERKKFAEKYFGGNWDEGHEARFHSIQGKAWQARQAHEREKAEKGEGPKPNVYNLWRDCSWRDKKPEFDDLKSNHRRRSLTDYARSLRLKKYINQKN